MSLKFTRLARTNLTVRRLVWLEMTSENCTVLFAQKCP